ncbi:MAG TPA: hypothetical protein VGO88_07615 [Mycetocola sp.]|jgi:hypothetical protein|uniref:hypothetical protein n=1 Tax=Mycetocola sp. TaxID=1871042 RepID=UPI00261F3220|nr:hypothetical protein [Mycetocola sp.]MCU1419169.1 hypothetical protein [Mycetocola sp.]MCU1559670.1 hypothetical protein [Mycetocola sp.]HEV7849175.1 hypothetical protein [Mycetocola sp.]
MKSAEILKASLKWGGVLAVAIAVVGGGLGYLFDGSRGLTSALIGTAMSILFLGITAASILFANRWFGTDLFVPIFFGIVMGGWLVKFVLFLVLAVLLRDQPWINPTVLFLSIIAGVIAALTVDVIVVSRSRMPYVSDISLPGDENRPK